MDAIQARNLAVVAIGVTGLAAWFAHDQLANEDVDTASNVLFTRFDRNGDGVIARDPLGFVGGAETTLLTTRTSSGRTGSRTWLEQRSIEPLLTGVITMQDPSVDRTELRRAVGLLDTDSDGQLRGDELDRYRASGGGS